MKRNLFMQRFGWLTSLFLTQFMLLAARLATAQTTCGYYPLTTSQFASAANVSTRSGTGGLCTFLTCSISNEANVTDNSLTNSATVSLNIIGATGAISTGVTNTLPAGATAGYVIGSGALNLGVGTSIQITTYLNGTQQDQGTVASLVNLSLLNAGTSFVGIPTTKPFNEIQIKFNLLAGSQTYNVYYPLATYTGGATVTNPTVAATTSGVISLSAAGGGLAGNVPYTYLLTNAANATVGTTQTTSGLTTGTYTGTVSAAVGCLYTKTIDLGPIACGLQTLTTNNFTGVTINTATVGGDVRTGISSTLCVGCSITNTGNVVDATTTNLATINVLAGIASSGRISVLDTRRTYPAGLKAGFVLQDGGLLGTALFNGTKIRTFLNGVQQEESSVTGLLDLPLLTTGYSSIGFTTTKAFDEVQLDASSLVGALINVNVAYAFVQNGPIIGLTTQTNPTSASLANGAIDVTITGGTTPYTYAWSNGATTQDLTGLAVGIYSLSVTDAATCGATRSFTLAAPGGILSLTLANTSLTITTGQNTSLGGSLVTQLNPTGGVGVLLYTAVSCQTGLPITTSAQGGLLVVNPTTGLYTYTPALGFTGTDTFCVRICDSTLPLASCRTATVNITVGGIPLGNCAVQAHALSKLIGN